MLNKETGQRELAYIVRIDGVEPIPGRDRVECCRVGGWTVMCKKGQFQQGDLGIYFEIDSKVPEKEPFDFLASKHYKIKTQKYALKDENNNKLGHFYSQGLLMSAEDFGWIFYQDDDGTHYIHNIDKNIFYKEGTFLTEELGVTYAVDSDNKRKGKTPDKYKIMAQRRPDIFKKTWAQWMMRRSWGKRIMFLLFGKKRDNRIMWPSHIASKTDVERVQNMIWILNDKQPYVATEKIDGSSCSIMAERGRFGKINYYVCSRNVVFKDENDKCFYDDNIYFEAYKKYNLKEIITKILNDYDFPNVALQMEVFGPGVQKRDYSLKEHEIRVFHIVVDKKKLPMDKVVEICRRYDLPHVPIIDDNYVLPNTLEELQEYVESKGSDIDGKMKEGIVFYDKATGQQYFKFVSPEFLMKYH